MTFRKWRLVRRLTWISGYDLDLKFGNFTWKNLIFISSYPDTLDYILLFCIMAMMATMNHLPSTDVRELHKRRGPHPEGDVSSIFASMANDPGVHKRGERLPERFVELKRDIIGDNGNAILASWKRLLPIIEAKVREAKQRGPSIFPELDFSDVEKNSVDAGMIDRIKQTGACIIRNTIPREEAVQYLIDICQYIKENPTSKGSPLTP